jgi:hypothetical protein
MRLFELLQLLPLKYKQRPRSFKELVNNVLGLEKQQYMDSILPEIDEYCITDKADGTRTLLVLNPDFVVQSFHVNGFNFNERLPIGYMKPRRPTILDAEMLDTGQFLIFDVLMWEGQPLAQAPFQKRMEYLAFHKDLAKKFNLYLTAKHFEILQKGSHGKQIKDFIEQKRDYKTDGIIFTQITKPYLETQNYKWKPPEHLTIDFLAIQTDQSKTFQLFSGIQRNQMEMMGYSLSPDEIHRLGAFYTTNQNYVPIPFRPSLAIDSTDVLHADQNLHGKIVEVVWNSTWQFVRVRTDRNGELQSGTYFGNNFRIAELTFMTIMHPITVEFLASTEDAIKKQVYFQKTDDSYKTIRKFNNHVKDICIRNTVRKPSCIVDLASGKGQDLMKYFNHEFAKQVIMVEVDSTAIDEIIRRKYDLLKMSPKNQTGLKLNVIEYDLLSNSNALLQKINNIGHCGASIFCHFAFHYLIPDREHGINMVSLISSLLKQNGSGEFVFTAFDGARVFDWLQKHNGKWTSTDGRFMIQANYKSKQLQGFGHSIHVLLPCSPVPYDENLIDITELDKLFMEHSILRTGHTSFAEYIGSTYTKDMFSQDEINFVSLYSVYSYKYNGI